ncbi:uncharacterized protein BXZ73DRAFT_47962 [Epithele typhae]|uniref:uncharacterized protein n=1 Tax=Epithele typhae TaxID=378194 RepID=UPI002007A531|nr:uncharacterized protein BXZ73DRAFT_47962 [Epithele typhae]KAH9929507.1 hypothetical protein BXZ73DRAFT_47962 [Epithele typhae]
MDALPSELISYIFDFIHAPSALSNAMLVNTHWYIHGARNLHHRVKLRLSPGLTTSSSDTIIIFMKRLVASTLSTAHLIHHLSISGITSFDVQSLILTILERATAIRSLDVHELRLPQGELHIPPDCCTSSAFLPNLMALNVHSVQLYSSLCGIRRLSMIRIHHPIDEPPLRMLVLPTSPLVTALQRLQLVIAVADCSNVVTSVASLASALEAAPLCSLGLQFVLDSPGPVSWAEFEDTVIEMGPSLRRLTQLQALGLVVRPDPIIPLQAGVTAGDQLREAVTKTLAERLLAENGLDQLVRMELRWHGWVIRGGTWISLARTQMLRMPWIWPLQELGAVSC